MVRGWHDKPLGSEVFVKPDEDMPIEVREWFGKEI